MSFKQQLIKMSASKEAIDWAENRTLQQIWNDCPRGDWMLWLLEEMKEKKGWLDEKEIMLLGCWCIRRVLEYVPEEETIILKAIEAKEKWIKGEITREEMIAAMNIVRAITMATAWSTASAAAFCAANFAVSVIASTTSKFVVWDTIFNEESLIQANYIRAQFTPPV